MQREAGVGGAHPHLSLLSLYGALTHRFQKHADSVKLDELCCEVIQKTIRRPGLRGNVQVDAIVIFHGRSPVSNKILINRFRENIINIAMHCIILKEIVTFTNDTPIFLNRFAKLPHSSLVSCSDLFHH